MLLLRPGRRRGLGVMVDLVFESDGTSHRTSLAHSPCVICGDNDGGGGGVIDFA